ncbi:MICAL-like protein 2 [Anolis carolinensis]|uniref:MICAL-like protein 2 n=1 Tax=Anolis carolinensis TaxID=28377 RepID=UPI002F2B3C5A
MAAIQALQQWCKQQCQGYKDVNITNMTTSFRDGLAFCAILHRHRPDLINFSSLRKENVYENNELAFKVAETELGIPALLDAEDMVALKVPDRLSILTYVSQYYNYFHGRSPIGGMAGIKRSPSNAGEEPAGKKVISEPEKPAPAKPSRVYVPPEPKTNPAWKGKENAPVEARQRNLAESTNPRNSNCTICGNHVHLVQRLLMDGKLYHRSCFRCKQCSNTLKSGNYKAGKDPGTFICNGHEQPNLHNASPVNQSNVIGDNKTTGLLPTSGSCLKGFEAKKPELESKKPSQAPQRMDVLKAPAKDTPNLGNHKPGSVVSNPNSRWSELNTGNKSGRSESLVTSPDLSHWTPTAAKTQQAREKFFQASDQKEPTKSQDTLLNISQVTGKMSKAGDSEKERARNILMHVLPAPQTSTNKPPSLSTTSVKAPPSPLQHLQTKNIPTSEISKPVTRYSDTEKPQRDPFGVSSISNSSAKSPGNRAEIGTAAQSSFKAQYNGPKTDSGHKADVKAAKVGATSAVEEKSESPAEWRSRLKPVANKISDRRDARTSPKPAEIHKTVVNVPVRPAPEDRKPVTPPAIQETAPSPDSLPKKKLLVPQVDLSGGWQKTKQRWDGSQTNQNLEVPGPPKVAVAPVRPSSPKISQKHPSRQVVSPSKRHPEYIPEEKIQTEVRQIEKELDRLEHQGVDLEKQLRGCEGDEREDALMVEWFKLIHEKQLLLRRESELMHKMNQQKLEEKQWDIETELRILMSKSDFVKTPKEKRREEELLKSYVETVNDRNKIVEDLDEDRLREQEEDEVLAAMIQRLDGPRNTQESEKKKPKFGLFKLWLN